MGDSSSFACLDRAFPDNLARLHRWAVLRQYTLWQAGIEAQIRDKAGSCPRGAPQDVDQMSHRILRTASEHLKCPWVTSAPAIPSLQTTTSDMSTEAICPAGGPLDRKRVPADGGNLGDLPLAHDLAVRDGV